MTLPLPNSGELADEPRHEALSCADALDRLLEGNDRFRERFHDAALVPVRVNRDSHPIAAILTCSDLPLPIQTIFDADDDLFVIRTAGHVVDDAVMASVEYAVEKLRVPLVVVLSHHKCEAVKEALDEIRHVKDPYAYKSKNPIVNDIAPAVRTGRITGKLEPDDIERDHLRSTGVKLASKCLSIRLGIVDGTVGLATMYFTDATGEVELLSEVLP